MLDHSYIFSYQFLKNCWLTLIFNAYHYPKHHVYDITTHFQQRELNIISFYFWERKKINKRRETEVRGS